MRELSRLLAAVVVVLVLSAATHAASVTYTDVISVREYQNTSQTIFNASHLDTLFSQAAVKMPKFVPTRGTLDSVTLTLATDIEIRSHAQAFFGTHAASTVWWYSDLDATVGGLQVVANDESWPGAGGHNRHWQGLENKTETWTWRVKESASVTTGLTPFIGTGALTVDVIGDTSMHAWWNPVLHHRSAWNGEYSVSLRYDYTPAAPPPPDVAPETKADNVTSTDGGAWDSKYKIGFTDGTLTIDIAILLIPTAGVDPDVLAQRKVQWETGIEDIWSDAYEIAEGSNLYPIQVNVDWVTDPLEADYIVAVYPGSGNVTMSAWYLENPSGWGNDYHDEIAAHEAGHYMGLYDEYPGGALDPAMPWGDPPSFPTDSIMADLGEPREWHFEGILAWLSGHVTGDLSLAGSPVPQYVRNPRIPGFRDLKFWARIPEPTTAVLVALGVLGILTARSRRRRR
jgi:hypothetical protein